MPYIEVDAAAITANVRRLGDIAGRDVIVVVKANAYGHGAAIAADSAVAGGAVALATADVAEAVQLREHGVTRELVSWLHSADPDFALAVEHDIDVGVSSVEHLQRAAAVSTPQKTLGVQLKFDTGLGRNGIPECEWGQVVERAATLQREGRLRVTGIMSHVAGTSAEADLAQAARFGEIARKTAYLEPERIHLTASAATMQLGDAHTACNAVRVGILAYGLHPDGADADGALARELGVRPALRLLGTATDGVLDVGYQHGLLHAPGAWVLVNGERVDIAEQRASETVLDKPVSGDAVVIGDPALGEPGAGMWAEAVGTINYEIVARLSAALERRVKGQS